MGQRSELPMANRRARETQRETPRAVTAYFDRRTGRVVVELSTKVFVSFSPDDAQGLEGASASELKKIEITPSGLGLHFPNLDADLYLPALLEGFLGSRRWMAARMGEAGGSSKSVAKRAASRANGKLGGRPRKKVAG